VIIAPKIKVYLKIMEFEVGAKTVLPSGSEIASSLSRLAMTSPEEVESPRMDELVDGGGSVPDGFRVKPGMTEIVEGVVVGVLMGVGVGVLSAVGVGVLVGFRVRVGSGVIDVVGVMEGVEVAVGSGEEVGSGDGSIR
jgi:hypothetical protein